MTITAALARRTWTRRAGYLVLLASLVFLGRALARLDPLAILARISAEQAAAAGVASLAYALLLTMLGAAWAGCAGGLPLRRTLAVYGPGVMAKYVPGTVLQYASRHVLGAAAGLAQPAMVRASLVEAAGHVMAALCVAAVFLSGSLLPIGLAAAGSVLALPGRMPLMRAAGLQLAFFLSLAGIVAGLAGLTGLAQPQVVAGHFMLAWLAGFLVPVAPGGIGVREAALVALAGASGESGLVIMLAIVVRLVTTVGDALFGAAGVYVGRGLSRSNRHASA